MKLSRSQALDLVKVLSHYQTFDRETVLVDVDVDGLCRHLEDIVLNRDDEGDEEEDDEENDSEEADESSADDVEDPCEQEDDAPDDDVEEETDVSEVTPDDSSPVVSPGDLHELKPVRGRVIESSAAETGESFNLEFENFGVGQVDLLLDAAWVGPLSRVKRTGTELHVMDSSDSWHRFSVSKFPKDWQRVLPIGDPLRVSDR